MIKSLSPRGVPRIAIITPTLAAYRVPVFNRLSRLNDLDVHLIFSTDKERSRAWDTSLGAIEFNYTLLSTWNLTLPTGRRERSALSTSPGLWRFLSAEGFELAVALGWTMPNTMIAWLHGKRHKRPTIVWDESIPHPPSRTKKLLMPFIRRYIGSFDGHFAASHACIEYMVQLGAARERVALLPQITDNVFFAREAEQQRGKREALKRGLGISTQYVILYIGQLIHRKNVLALLDAFRDLATRREDVSLLMVGEGELRDELIRRIAEYQLGERVKLESFASQAVLPKYYALADAFILPSVYDTFGVVVAEAMASGLPIISTPSVGATSSIVVNGGNGLLVEHTDTAGMTRAMERLIADDVLRAQMGAESERIIATWDTERVALNFSKLVTQCLRERVAPRGAQAKAVPRA